MDAQITKTDTTIAYIPAIISAAVSVLLIRSGFLAFLFLVPLGFVAYSYNVSSSWVSAGIALVLYSIVSIGLSMFFEDVFRHPSIDILFFTLMVAVFTWIVAAPITEFGNFQLSLVYRFILGSAFGVFILWIIISNNEDVFDFLVRTEEIIQNSILEQYNDPESVIALVKHIMFRGGALASGVIIFFMNRQMSVLVTRIIRRIDVKDNIGSFYVHSKLIWVLSFSLFGALSGRFITFTPFEILSWNIIVSCVILYLIQGAGILRHFLVRLNLSPIMRVVLSALCVILIFNPATCVIFLGALMVLGIAENWVPFRAPKSDKPSSTPKM